MSRVKQAVLGMGIVLGAVCGITLTVALLSLPSAQADVPAGLVRDYDPEYGVACYTRRGSGPLQGALACVQVREGTAGRALP